MGLGEKGMFNCRFWLKEMKTVVRRHFIFAIFYKKTENKFEINNNYINMFYKMRYQQTRSIQGVAGKE